MVSGLESILLTLKEMGVTLLLLWLLTLSIVYGLLSHANLPKSVTVRGAISLVCAFLVLLAAAASPAVAFLQNLITASIVLAFGILLAVIFLEVGGVKSNEKHIISAHPKFFGTIILLIFVGIILGAGGLDILGIPEFELSETVVAVILFGGVMIVAIWFMIIKEGGEKK